MSRAQHRVFEHVHTVPDRGHVAPAHAHGRTVTYDKVLERGIEIGAWTIRVMRGSIANAADMDALSDKLGISPPEMPFLHNALILEHKSSGFSYIFDAVRALQCVQGVRSDQRRVPMDCVRAMSDSSRDPAAACTILRRASRSGVQVSYAKKWGESRQRALSSSPSASSSQPLSMTKSFDWTYSTTWPGMPGESNTVNVHASTVPTTTAWDTAFHFGTDPVRDRIPIERLGPSSGEPILFYDDIVLFEDELADNGTSTLNVKVRVMPSGWLVLQRFFLRVDNVLFRVFDTRMYVSFDSQDAERDEKTSELLPRVIRECRGMEAPYDAVLKRLPIHRSQDLSLLTNVAWVTEILDQMAVQNRRMAPMAPAPAHAPHAPGVPAATIESPDKAVLESDAWDGHGYCVQVAVLRQASDS